MSPPLDPEADAVAHREGACADRIWRKRAAEGDRLHLAALRSH